MRFRDRTGEIHGSLTVIQRVLYPSKSVYWECQCVCGNNTIVRGNKLGRVKSCGCNQHHGELHKTHGMYKSKIYKRWNTMISRCNKPHYKKRAITVCERWKVFENFYEDMGDVPDNLTLDRIDNNKGYYKENCRWTTAKVQMNNTSNNRYVTYKNMTKTLIQWCEELDVDYGRTVKRISRGLPLEDVFKKERLKPGKK